MYDVLFPHLQSGYSVPGWEGSSRGPQAPSVFLSHRPEGAALVPVGIDDHRSVHPRPDQWEGRKEQREHSTFPFKDPAWNLKNSLLLTYHWSELSYVSPPCGKGAWEMCSGKPCALIN